MTPAYATTEYLGAKLEMPDWLVPLWPVDMPRAQWPTYCGSGGLGDIFVPDQICGAIICEDCFIHDIEFAVLPREWWAFQQSNNRLYTNLASTLSAQITDAKTLAKAKRIAMRYWAAVSLFGWRHFDPENENPWSNNTVRARLNRLAKARYLE